jgi:hypothetical protein
MDAMVPELDALPQGTLSGALTSSSSSDSSEASSSEPALSMAEMSFILRLTFVKAAAQNKNA